MVLLPLTILVLVVCALLALTACYHLYRRRLVDDRLLAVAGVLEVGLLVQLVVGLTRVGGVEGGPERATFVAYLFTAVIVPPFVSFLAIKEKSQWAMAVVLVGAFVSAVLVGRLDQIWNGVGA